MGLEKRRHLRVAFVLSTISGRGGPQRFMAEVGRQLSLRGHQVYYVAWFFDPSRTFSEFGRLTVRASRKRFTRSVLSKVLAGRWGTSSPKLLGIPLSVFTNPVLILRGIFEVNPDVVVVSSGHTLSCLLTRICRALIVCRYPALPSTFLDLPLGKYLKRLELATMKNCLGFVNSESLAKAVLANSGMRLPVINPGVDLERFSHLERNDDGRTLLYLSRIRPNKNQAFLVEMMPKLLEKHDVKLVLAGEIEGRDVAYLRQLRDRVEQLRLGQAVEILTKLQDVREIYSRATIYLHPAVGEPFGMTIVEAMACGLPVVVHNTVGASDAVEPGKSGFLVGGEFDDWIEKIGILLSDREAYDSFSKEARRRARQFSWDRVSHRFENLLWDALDARDGTNFD